MNWPAGSSHHIAGQSLHVVTDPLGTPRELVSDDGEVVWAGQLRTWGRLDRWVVKESDTRLARRLPQGYRAAANDPYIEVELRFQNQWEDPESGLYYNYQRYYDPDTGQYLSPDPIGLRGGLRPHGYVHNPVGWVDPWGLAACPEGTPPQYRTQDHAAKAAFKKVNPLSINDNLEYGGLIFRDNRSGRYGFTGPIKGSDQGVNPHAAQAPHNSSLVGDYHTHGDYSLYESATGKTIRTSDLVRDAFNSDNFSPQDISGISADGKGIPGYKGYLGTPSGIFKVYDPSKRSVYILK